MYLDTSKEATDLLAHSGAAKNADFVLGWLYLAPPVGFEPTTSGLEVLCSIQLSYGGSHISIAKIIVYIHWYC